MRVSRSGYSDGSSPLLHAQAHTTKRHDLLSDPGHRNSDLDGFLHLKRTEVQKFLTTLFSISYSCNLPGKSVLKSDPFQSLCKCLGHPFNRSDHPKLFLHRPRSAEHTDVRYRQHFAVSSLRPVHNGFTLSWNENAPVIQSKTHHWGRNWEDIRTARQTDARARPSEHLERQTRDRLGR